MKTVDFFKRNYRELKGSTQNIIISKIEDMYFDVKQSCIEDALWDSSLTVWMCHDLKTVIKFDTKSFEHFSHILNTYIEMDKKQSS